MSLFRLLIVALAAVAPPSERSSAPNPLPEAALQRFKAMQPADQQQWLLRLEKRLNRANRLNLKPEDAEKERLAFAARLRQQPLSDDLLKELIEQTDEREKITIARSAGVYRKLVFEIFAGQQKKIFERQHAWEQLYKSWKKAEKPFEQQDRLLDWLEKAVQALASKNAAPIPPAPKFTPDPKEQSIPLGQKTAEHVGRIEQKPSPGKNPAAGVSNTKTSAVEVNREELAARIAGLNMNLRALETELDEQKEWNVDQLTQKIGKLKTLVQQRNDLSIVRDLLSDEDQKYLVKFRSTCAVVAQMGQLIAHLRAN